MNTCEKYLAESEQDGSVLMLHINQISAKYINLTTLNQQIQKLTNDERELETVFEIAEWFSEKK